MTRESGRLSVICMLAVLTTPLSGQATQPTLENTMNFIANALNSRGTISWTEELPEVFGVKFSMTSTPAEVNADSSACSLSWTSVYTSSGDKLVESFVVRLGMVSSAVVQPYSKYRQPIYQYKVEVSPETYVVVIKTDSPLVRHRELYHKKKLKSEPTLPNDREATILFADEQIANKVVDGIRQAAELCAAKRSSP